jgi:hypothetical protein
MTKLEEELKEARNQAEEADKKYDEVAKKLAQVNTVFTTEPMYYLVVFTPHPTSHHGNVWLLPVFSLLLANTVARVQACLSI